MSFLEQVSVLILTHDEAPNIARTLDALVRFPEVVVLDSGSQDATPQIASGYANVRVETRPFDNHATQWTHGLQHCGIAKEWVLALDADYVVPTQLVDEMAAVPGDTPIAGFRVAFRYCIFGKPLSATLYPPIVALYRRHKAHYVQEGHTQRVVVEGPIGELRGRIDHDDRKPLARWLVSQQRYARLEAEHIISKPVHQLRRIDRVRLMAWPVPLLIPFYMLFVKRCLLDGWPGWLYVLQRTLAETMIAIEIVDRRLRAAAD